MEGERMSILQLIKSHEELKYFLSDYLAGTIKKIDPNTILNDRACDLGEWLYKGEANNHLTQSEIDDLIKCHKAMHFSMAEIISNYNRGVVISEDIVMGPDSPFIKNLDLVLKQLYKLKNKSHIAA